MIRFPKKYSLEEVFPFIILEHNENAPKRIMFDGHLIKMKSMRLKLFVKKGVVCAHCGLEGKFFYKEQHFLSEPYHLNLYGEKDGEEILMTKDHIVPVSKGGKNSLDNYQAMCCKCNQAKSDKIGD